MAVVLNTTLKMDGKLYEEGSEVSSLPNKVRKFAKDNDLLMAVVDPEDLAELEDEDEDEEDDDEGETEDE